MTHLRESRMVCEETVCLDQAYCNSGVWRSLTGGLYSSGNAGLHRDALYCWSWRYPFFCY